MQTFYQPIVTRDLPSHLEGDIDRKTVFPELKKTEEAARQKAESELEKLMYPDKAVVMPVQVPVS